MASQVTSRQIVQAFETVMRLFETNALGGADKSATIEALDTVRDLCAETAAMLRQMPDG